jgi:hypothetical protein
MNETAQAPQTQASWRMGAGLAVSVTNWRRFHYYVCAHAGHDSGKCRQFYYILQHRNGVAETLREG